MFWGCIVKPGKPHKLQESLDDVVLVSNVSLNASTGGKTSLFVKVGDGESLLITSLEPGKHEHAQVHLYFRITDGVTFSVQGNGEVHICGYFDLEEGGLDDDEDLDEEEFAALRKQQKKLEQEVEGEEEDDEDELEEEDLAPAKPQKQIKTDEKKAAAPAKPVQQPAAAKPAQQAAAPANQAKTAQAPAQAAQQAAAPAKQAKTAQAPAQAAKKTLDEMDDDDLENMTESELAALEAELEGDEGDEELDEEDLEGLEDDDLEGAEEDDEEGEEEEAPKKNIPNVSSANPR